MWQMTTEKMDELARKIAQQRTAMERLRAMSDGQIWCSELDEITAALADTRKRTPADAAAPTKKKRRTTH